MSLFQSLSKPDHQRTMLAYRVKHWPWGELSPAAKSKLVSNKLVYLPKHMILDACNEERTHMFFKDRRYALAWAWNNIPTELEWDKKSDNYLIRVELRVSPLIKEGYLALLSFELPSSLKLDQLLTAREEQPV
jgi:hypothetical protein